MRPGTNGSNASANAPLVVSYEDLVTDMAGTVGLIVQFLGLELPAGHVVEAPTRRQADEVSQHWAQRYLSRSPLGLWRSRLPSYVCPRKRRPGLEIRAIATAISRGFGRATQDITWALERLDVPSSLCPIRAIRSACPWPPPLVLERPARPFLPTVWAVGRGRRFTAAVPESLRARTKAGHIPAATLVAMMAPISSSPFTFTVSPFLRAESFAFMEPRVTCVMAFVLTS